ncbi:MAG TPA: hypothetical protein VEB69_01300 [Acidimicrobiia bacterium]|nr:hypothetical protein [Acidimicrobiia bacterium]
MNLNSIATPVADNPVESPASGSSMPSDDQTPKLPMQAQAAMARRLAGATTQTNEAMDLFKVSRDSASQCQDAGPVVDLSDELDGYTVSFTSLLADIDATPFMKGLPDDRCQCPHWGYVFKGNMTARYPDRDEVYEAGDAFYIPPGHIPVANEPGTEFVWFSPTEELRTAEAVMIKNMQDMQNGSTP